MDLLPISSNFFDQVAGFPNETFIAMRQKNDGECYMGFCCADVFGWGKIWNLFEKTQPSKKALEKILIKLFLYNTSDSFLRKCSPFHNVGLEWSFDQKLLTHCVSRLSINEKIVLTGLDFFSLHCGFTAKKAYFNCDDFMVSREWVKENAEKIIFYTRDDQRRLINYENEVGFLKKIVNI